jgi:hypothetical protein
LILDIHPARDIIVLPIFEEFLENPEIYHLDWSGKTIILRKDGFEIVESKE